MTLYTQPPPPPPLGDKFRSNLGILGLPNPQNELEAYMAIAYAREAAAAIAIIRMVTVQG